MISINEVLTTPMNTPMQYAKVFLVAVGTEGISLPFGEATAVSDATGTVQFDIPRGTYRAFLQQENTSVKYPVGYILESTFDNLPDPVTLGNILSEQLPEVVE